MKIKICGLFRENDAEYINKYNPDFAGFVFYPKSHRFTDDETAFNLRKKIKKDIKTVGVFVDDDKGHIISLYKKGVINIIQLHGHEDDEYIAEIRLSLPDAEIWKAFVVRNSEDLKAAEKSTADKILLDNGYGTGKCFDWSIINNFKRDFILAGGINPDNVKEIKITPWAVDVSSGVETNKVKDEEKIKCLIKNIRGVKKKNV